jgi:hypothetical protein
MAAEYLVTVPENITKTDMGIEFYDKVRVFECSAESMLDIYYQFPNAIKVDKKSSN